MILEDKKHFRLVYKQKIKKFISSGQAEAEKSKLIIQNLNRLPLFKKPFIASFQALPTEPCLKSLHQAHADSFVFPVLEQGSMDFYLPHQGCAFKKNSFSIEEPDPHNSTKIPLEDIKVFLIPGCSFDRQGGRLGRGRAYYDRLLGESSALKVGVAWSVQVHNSALPLESHDVLMDFIVTEDFVCFPHFSQKLQKLDFFN